MPRSTQVSVLSLSTSNTGLSPTMAELSSSLLLSSRESIIPTLQPRINGFIRFGLFPFRSPLLWESRLISFPSVTEMFHFTELALDKLCIHLSAVEHDLHWVSPFRNSRIIECLASPRNLSQLTTSFIAFRRQGIHPMLLSTCYSRKRTLILQLRNITVIIILYISFPIPIQLYNWFFAAFFLVLALSDLSSLLKIKNTCKNSS